ncbi:MAG: hypothetical protein RL514_3599 [Verrucomicrobiota bacterium]|jgi:predicted regulator of Ras-like GTPase activity (Roadblock/LC7/MglB family)
MLDSIRGLSASGGGTPASPAAPSAEAPPESLPIALKSVLDRLPVALKPLATRAANPDEKVNVPTAKVLAQLATGAVRITFEELRAAAPAGLFSAGGQGDALVDLPLPEVLRVAGPWMKRKAAPKAEPAAGSFFSGLGRGPGAAPAPAAPPVVAPIAPAPAPAPAAAAFTPAFAPAFQPAAEAPKGGTTFTSFQPAPEPFTAAPALFSPASTPAAPEEAASGVVPVKLAVLTVGWPDNVRKEATDLGDATVEFPREQLGNAMKSGKVSFTWGQLRSWMKPAVGPSLADNTVLSLPLRVLVQPFMANMRGGAKPAGSGDSGTSTFLNRVPAPSLTVPVAAPAPPVPVDTKLGEALGKPEKTHWTPTEIIQAVIAIPGVAGAMLSLQEGHLAAAELQATLPPELLAYALPKLFSVTGDQARQMKLGDPNVVSLVADGHHWAVFKLDKIFFTVMSRKGHLLPLPQLQTVATEIARQRK